jgi:hypothetical protein
MFLDGIGKIVVGIPSHRDGIGCFQLLHARRRQRQDLHIDTGGVHFRQPLGPEIAQAVHHQRVTAANLLRPLFDETCGTVKEWRARKMLFKRNGAHVPSALHPDFEILETPQALLLAIGQRQRQ